MPTWDELFRRGINIEGLAMEVAMMARVLVGDTNLSPSLIKIWDVGCGTGRHTVYLARHGFAVYASDNSPKAIELTRNALASERREAKLAVADMEERPFKDVAFHGIILWNVIQHANREKIVRVLQNLKNALLPGGLFLISVKSTKAEEYGKGHCIEENTFVFEEGAEAGVPHHYFSREELETLLAPFEILYLVESQEDYYAAIKSFMAFIPRDKLPYHNAHWVAMARNRSAVPRKS